MKSRVECPKCKASINVSRRSFIEKTFPKYCPVCNAHVDKWGIEGEEKSEVETDSFKMNEKPEKKTRKFAGGFIEGK